MLGNAHIDVIKNAKKFYASFSNPHSHRFGAILRLEVEAMNLEKNGGHS
jgi:hypothetical protein